MTARPLPEHAKLHQEFKDWEFGLAAHCKESEAGPEQLPSEVVQAWDDMDAAWSEIKDHSGDIPQESLQRFREAKERLQGAWDAMISSERR